MSKELLVVPKNLVTEYIKTKYPDKFILVIYAHDPEILPKICKDFDLSMSKLIINNYLNLLSELLFIEFTDEKEALEYCNSINEALAFSVVYKNGEPYHENT